MSYIDNNGKFNHGKWMRERVLNEAPIQRGKVDYSTIDLRSNIDLKWMSFEDMEDDLKQWLEASSDGVPSQAIKKLGIMFKELGIQLMKNPTNPFGDQFDQSANADRSPEADADKLRQAMQSRQDREI